MEIQVENIRGRPVIDRQGNVLGSIEDVAIDSQGWRVKGFIVGLRKEVADDLRVERPAFGTARLDITPARIEAVGQSILLNVGADEIARMLRGAQGE